MTVDIVTMRGMTWALPDGRDDDRFDVRMGTLDSISDCLGMIAMDQNLNLHIFGVGKLPRSAEIRKERKDFLIVLGIVNIRRVNNRENEETKEGLEHDRHKIMGARAVPARPPILPLIQTISNRIKFPFDLILNRIYFP